MNLPAHRGLVCVASPSAAAGADPATPGVAVGQSAPSRSRPQHDLAGYTFTRIILEFGLWAFERESFPTVEDIVERFHVSKATAYRWRNELGQAYRMAELPPNDASRRARTAPARVGAGRAR